MRLIIFFCTISFFIISCKQNNSKQKELEIRERELIMKEKEFSLKYSDSTQSENTITNTSIQTTNLETEQKIDLPFIGKKYFETRPGISGTGTPMRHIEILQNGDVFFEFIQINRADGTETKERYYAGKYKPFMKCFFKKWDNEITYYRITKEGISEVDKKNKILTGQECCINYDSEEECPCEDKLNQ